MKIRVIDAVRSSEQCQTCPSAPSHSPPAGQGVSVRTGEGLHKIIEKPIALERWYNRKTARLLKRAVEIARECPLCGLLHAHPVVANSAARGVMKFHDGPVAVVGGDGSPERRAQARRTLDDVLFANRAGPTDDTILWLLGHTLIGSNLLEEGRGIRRVGAGQIFLEVFTPSPSASAFVWER